MPLDPGLDWLKTMLSAGPSLSSGTVEQARTNLRVATVDLRDPSTKASVRSVEDTTYAAHEGPRPARVYRPHVEGPVPTVMFAHGGGYVLGDLDTHDPQARFICAEVGAVVVSIDYRLAPEHPFPSGHLDVVAGLRHVAAAVGELGGDPARLAVAGDSGGANLSAGAAVVARDEGIALAAQLLLYPSTDFTEEATYPSRVENAEGMLLSVDDMRWFRQHYLADPSDVRASLLHHPDLTGVAPAVVATAECDPLRDEGEAYAEALRAAGVPVVARRYDGLPHGFFGLGHVHPVSDKASREACADLKELLR
ncbi:MAG TPA: alpha/beta hydrolase [Mycobacteriales bacterium]|nr:alpha/beta hydrolase [Mycobacteriales bacterium]